MPDDKIKQILKRYLEGDAPPEQERMVDNWYESLSSAGDQADLSEAERAMLRDHYWKSLKAKMTGKQKRAAAWPQVITLAACVSILVMTALYYLPSEIVNPASTAVRQAASMHEIFNDSLSARQINLPDGSHVLLSPGSRIQYAEGFNIRERKVTLSGEAFFEIFHNAKKPFYVFTNEVVTKVLGTSFSVTAYPEDLNVTVSVKTGKVSVYTHFEENQVAAESEKVILTPNQKAVYSRSDNRVSRMLVKSPQVIIPEEEVQKIRFEGASASDIFAALEKMYGVEIVFKQERFSNCFLTTSVKGNDLYERIDVICDIIGATYSVENTRILINGSGCN